MPAGGTRVPETAPPGGRIEPIERSRPMAIVALEVVAALVLTGTMVVALGVLTAAALGRAVCHDEEQREAAPPTRPVRRAT
jgi:hypothetical protein